MTTEQSRTLLTYIPKISGEHRDFSLPSEARNDLYSKLLNPPTTAEAMSATLEHVSRTTLRIGPHALQEQRDDEFKELLSALLLKYSLTTLSMTMDLILSEALQAEEEVDWWRRVESSTWNTTYYMLQTFPIRIARLAHNIAIVARRNQVPLSFFSFNRETFRTRIVPHVEAFRSLFPMFSMHQSFSTRFAPHELARQECTAHRKELEAIRDERARQLGELSFVGTTIITALEDVDESSFSKSAISSPHDRDSVLAQLLAASLHTILGSDKVNTPEQIEPGISTSNASMPLQKVLRDALPVHSVRHQNLFTAHRRPGRWTRLWPRLVLFPPLILLTMRSVYQNRNSICATIIDAGRTVHSFWTQWVLEPIRDILKTVRTSGDDGAGRVISKDGLKSDMDSLERMVIALATEKQSWSDAELRNLSEQIQRGDLTSVLKVYEGDIKSPVRSALTGTLIRSLLIQVQKAKVDIDFALAGIDKLLRSQELTFGFVGVAPSLATLYAVGGWLRSSLWKQNSYLGKKYGGLATRRGSFYAMRRVESILTRAAVTDSRDNILSPFQAPLQPNKAFKSPSLSLDAKTHGLLIISLTYLRRFAEANLRKRSPQRQGFISDLVDLEDAQLSKEDKLRVVERMWRSWGMMLGWRTLAFA